MSRILIVEDDTELRVKIVEAFALLGLSAEVAVVALRAFEQAIRPPNTMVLSAHAFSGLEARISLHAQDYHGLEEGNHPDGWYRMFSDSCASRPDRHLNTRYRVQSALKLRQVPGLSFRVNNDNNARSLSSHRSPV